MNKSNKLIAFHNDEAIKAKYLARLREHQTSEGFTLCGDRWIASMKMGSPAGCTIQSNSMEEYEDQLGIPKELAILQDRIFVRLGTGRRAEWPEQFLSTIQVGSDLSQVFSKITVWLLVDPADGVIGMARTSATREAIEKVAELYSTGHSEKHLWKEAELQAIAAARESASMRFSVSNERANALMADAAAAWFAASKAASAIHDDRAASAWSENACDLARWAGVKFVAPSRHASKLLELLREASPLAMLKRRDDIQKDEIEMRAQSHDRQNSTTSETSPAPPAVAAPESASMMIVVPLASAKFASVIIP